MSLAEIGALIEADNRARMYAETWGHLAPELGRKYPGSVLFAHSVYGDGSVPIDTSFEDLPDSPWFYDGLCEMVMDHLAHGGKEGGVYRWSGVYELRITPAELDEEGYEIAPGSHEHVWTGEVATVVEPLEAMPGSVSHE